MSYFLQEKDKAAQSALLDPMKQAYSHGLEAVYAIETIDVKSIRKLEPKLPNPGFKSRPHAPSFSKQLSFGEAFQALCIGPLVDVKSMQSLAPSWKQVDLLSFFRTLFLPQSKKKVALFLKAEGLDFLVDSLELTPLERIELKRTPTSLQQEWVEKIKEALFAPDSLSLIRRTWERIFTLLITPWVERRLGLATLEELMERCERILTPSPFALTLMRWFEKLFFPEGLFGTFLIQSEEELFVSREVEGSRQEVMRLAMTYFYGADSLYPLDELTLFIERESALRWVGFPEGFVRKVLRTTLQFETFKNSRGKVLICLA